MKKSKVLCLGLAVTLVCSSLPQAAVQTYGETVKDAAAKEITADVSGNSTQEDEAEETVVEAEGLADEDGFEIDEDGVLIKYSGDATEVVIPDGVTSIADSAFLSCNLKSIEIPLGVTSIGNSAFFECGNLKSVTIPLSVTSIGAFAFGYCRGLSSITIPSSVTSIGANAFEMTPWLNAKRWEDPLVIVNNIVIDGRECSGDVKIQEGVTGIAGGAFNNCSSLVSIIIPSSMTNIGDMAFSYSGLQSIKVEDGNTKYDSRENCNALIETESNTLVCGGKNSIIPSSVTGIGDWAFCGCSELANITIPNSVTSIGNHAFSSCSELTNITIPDSVNYIEDNVFARCSGLISIRVEEGNIKYDSRESCNAIIEIESNTLVSGCKNTIIPSSVTNIGDEAFSNCSELTNITIPNGVTSIGSWAFSNCSSLTNIMIPDSVTYIGNYAFFFSGLTSITILDGVTSIGDSAFEGCSDLTSITIPDSVTSIAVDAFDACENLTIRGTTNSYAETYAKEHNIPFESIGVLTKALSDCQITIPSASAIYNGKAQTITVTIKDGTYTLKEGTDYTVAYSNNTNAGTATVTITGKGNYTGTAARNFTIQKGFQSLSVAKNTYDKAYGNGAFNLGVKRETGDGALTYKTSDKKVADVDVAGKVTIKGTGSATITVSAEESANYNASPELKITVKVSPTKQTVKSLKTTKGRKLTVSWKKDTKADGYEIWCSTDKKFKKNVKKKTVNSNKTTSKTFTKLTAGKKYYVRVCAYKTAKVNGKSTKLYGAWSSSTKPSKSIKK